MQTIASMTGIRESSNSDLCNHVRCDMIGQMVEETTAIIPDILIQGTAQQEG